MDTNEWQEFLEEASESAQALSRLGAIDDGVAIALEAFRAQDGQGFHDTLERADILRSCHLVCHWFCSKDCVLRCLRLAGPPPSVRALPDPREFADVVAKISGEEHLLTTLVEITEQEDAERFKAFVEELDLQRFSHLLCYWVCQVRCRLVCRWLCERDGNRPDLVKELFEAGRAVRQLAASPRALAEAIEAIQSDDCERLQKVVTSLGLGQHCVYICWWLCTWRCHRICLIVCRQFLAAQDPEPDDDEILAFAKVMDRLVEQPDLLKELAESLEMPDEKAFANLIQQHELQRFCVQLCHWLCSLRCRRFCICVCPPLLARVDTPASGACASSTVVPGCAGPGGPLVGIEITGSAAGGGFDHYTLRYSWGAGSPINTAVVYPDCSRPPATLAATTPVLSGRLGWLDVTLLPPGVTSFTVYLDVFDSAAGSVSDSTTFAVRTEAIEIAAAATLETVEGEDPFHSGTFTKLLKAVSDPSVLVPEQSVGGSFSVDGSAYVIGCDRILSQYGLVYFDAPPAAPPPAPTNSTGGVPIITAVPYEDVPAHPWQSGCFPVMTPNIILNGNLVSRWSTVNCSFGSILYKVPKVRPRPNWPSSSLNGRFVVLVEARDRPVAGAWVAGAVAGVDRVVLWIDNHEPTASITSIGGIAGCGDVLLSTYKDSTAEIRGVAWDPPIVPTAPQQAPNDNFGSYALSYQKNGEATALAIPALTPNTRVPNIWPGPLAPTDEGTLANWDIVGAIDYTGPAPTPPGKLARGERCAFVIKLRVVDTTHVGDSGNHHDDEMLYAITIINDL